MDERLSRRRLLQVAGAGFLGTGTAAARSMVDPPAPPAQTEFSRTRPARDREPTRSAEVDVEPEARPEPEPRPQPASPCAGAGRIESDDPLTVEFESPARLRCVGDPVAPGAGWQVAGGRRLTDPDADAVRVSARTGTPRVSLSRAFPGGVDLADRSLSLSVHLRRPAYQTLVVRLRAPDRANAVVSTRFVRQAGERRIDLAPDRVVGRPDLTDVRGIDVGVGTAAGRGLDLQVGDPRATPTPDRGAVLLTFDDNSYSQYSTAFPRMEAYGFPGVVGVIADLVGDDNRIPPDGMRAMQDAGWEMVSHPQRPGAAVPDMPGATQERAVRANKRWLVDNGYERGSQFIIWPFNQYDERSLATASRYHSLGFAGGGGPSGGTVTGPLAIGRVNGDEVARTRRLVDLAARYNGLLVVMFHTVGTDRLSADGFERVLQAVDAADVDVLTASDLWARCRAEIPR